MFLIRSEFFLEDASGAPTCRLPPFIGSVLRSTRGVASVFKRGVIWYFVYAYIWSEFLSRFTEITFWLRIVIYDGVAVSLLLLFFGVWGLISHHPIVILLDGLSLFLIGSLNLGGDFLAVAALKRYGIYIDLFSSSGSKAAFIIGLMQLYWGFIRTRAYKTYTSTIYSMEQVSENDDSRGIK